MTDKETFLLYKNHYKQIMELDDVDAGKLFKAIYLYVNNITPELDPKTQVYTAFTFIKTQIDFSTEKYTKKCEQNRKNAQKRYTKKAIACDCMHNDNDNDNDIDNDIDILTTSSSCSCRNKENEQYTTTSTDTTSSNNKNFLKLGEFANVYITQEQYKKQLSCLKEEIKEKGITLTKEEQKTFIDYIISELDCNIALGNVSHFNELEPNKHATMLHQYRRQKLKVIDKPEYIAKWGNFIQQLKKSDIYLNNNLPL